MQLVEGVYNVTKRLPDLGEVGLCKSFEQCGWKNPAKIAEGWGKKKHKKLSSVIKNTVRASLFTTETYLIVLKNVDLVSAEEETKLLGYVDEVKKNVEWPYKVVEQQVKTKWWQY